MWNRGQRSLLPEGRALVEKIRSKKWRSPAERDDLLRRLTLVRGIGSDDITALLLSSDAAVRSTASEMVRKLPPPVAGEVLLSVMSRQAEPAAKTTFENYLALSGGTLPSDRLGTLLADPRPVVAAQTLAWMSAHPAPSFLSFLPGPLRSPSAAVRRQAVAVAAAIGTAAAADLAPAVSQDEDEEVRFKAAGLLARHPTPERISFLLRSAADTSARIQEAALRALQKLPGTGSNSWQLRAIPLFSDTNAHVREFAADLLKAQDPPLVVATFAGTFKNVYGPARDRAISAFQNLGQPFLHEVIAQARSEDQDSASLASSIAVAMRTPEVVPLCTYLLQQPDWWLQHRAAEALAEIRDPRGLEPLSALLTSRESDLTAAWALGVWGTSDVLPALTAAYQHGEMDLRLEIVDALARIRDPRIPQLLGAVAKSDPESLVREKGARLLRELQGGGQQVTPEGRHFEPIDLASRTEVTLNELLQHARAIEASDLHLAVHATPHVRVHGVMTPLLLSPLTEEAVEKMVFPVLTEAQRVQLVETRHLDFCLKGGTLGRFRVNVFYQRKGLDAVFRLIPTEAPSLEDIGLPESVWEVTGYTQGLVVVTGPAGSGKTTTLAALVDHINRTRSDHIITIEDPIEYMHEGRNCLITQREIPAHSESFAKALRQCLREDPDVILVGEMRDLETIALAVTAAETGHLVFGTLHTPSASGTVDRIIDAFPPSQQAQIRQMLADSLKAVIAQTLLPRRDGRGRVPAFEILRNTPNVAGLIRDAKTFQLPSAIQTGGPSGMQMMDTALLQLAESGVADPRAAWDRAIRKEIIEPFLENEGSAA